MDKKMPVNGCAVRVIARPGSWIETEAVDQLERTAGRFGMKLAVGLPDLHPGRGHPIGAAFLTAHAVYPQLVGNDIGCGMALFRTNVPAHFRDFDRWTRRLDALERPLDPSLLELASEATHAAGWVDSLGTLGGGNHFAELLKVSEVYDDAFQLPSRKLVLLVHSGSRGLGQSILEGQLREHGDGPLTPDGFALKRYLTKHDAAVGWARDNRRIIGERFLRAIRTTGELALDLTHNSVSVHGEEFLHRKGAAPADSGAVVIPGSRGSHSYLVKPTALAAETDFSAWSLAHGAGRRWKRSECKARLAEKFSSEDLARTSLGSRVICGDRALLYEEAPQAYKDVDGVIEDLRSAGLVTLAAQLTPVLTFKKGN
ncbi:MAG TPA: RNA ligase RtcB family protein [Myxococcales bacterium]|nr:RNA ligase RtcB family protein [Myxococcales bacterium]